MICSFCELCVHTSCGVGCVAYTDVLALTVLHQNIWSQMIFIEILITPALKLKLNKSVLSAICLKFIMLYFLYILGYRSHYVLAWNQSRELWFLNSIVNSLKHFSYVPRWTLMLLILLFAIFLTLFCFIMR